MVPESAMEEVWSAVGRTIEEATGSRWTCRRNSNRSGGCIHECFLGQGEDGRNFFIKVNRRLGLSHFSAEVEGLRAIEATGTVRVPRVIGMGECAGTGYLVLEALKLVRPGIGSEAGLGAKLAALHQSIGPAFGFESDNMIGELPQRNTPMSDDWVEFYREFRLGFQIELARSKGLSLTGVERLLNRIGCFFREYQPRPSLLHGDLWGGNVGYLESGEAVVFDPAVYYGDREADLAFTEMFGGFGPDFYQAYKATWPLDPGYSQRKELYNLYHQINHYNHFGGAYGRQAQDSIHRLLEFV